MISKEKDPPPRRQDAKQKIARSAMGKHSEFAPRIDLTSSRALFFLASWRLGGNQLSFPLNHPVLL
jgi:hypothetical protein